MNINSSIRHKATNIDWKGAAAKTVLTFMDRRIPTTVPKVSPEKGDILESKLQAGDVVLTSDCAYPGWGRMEYWAVDSNYTHAAIVGNDDKVYEATGAGVIASDVDGYFKGHLKTAILRPEFASPTEDGKAITEYCKSHVGKPYDNLFRDDDDSEFYCSELVAKALTQVSSPLTTPSTKILGRQAIAPDAFEDIPGMTWVHDEKSTYWGNQLAHWPVGLSALVGGAAGAALSPTIPGAIIGGALGFLTAVGVGNKIQTGTAFPLLKEVLPKSQDTGS